MARKIVGFIFLIVFLCLISIISYADVLIIPDNVTTIEDMAFYGDTSLDEVVLPEGIWFIGRKAFANSSLKRINLPASVSVFDLGIDAFQNCEDLQIDAEEGTPVYKWAVAHGYIPGSMDLPKIYAPSVVNAGEDFQICFDSVIGAGSYDVWYEPSNVISMAVPKDHVIQFDGYTLEPGTYIFIVKARDRMTDQYTESYAEFSVIGEKPDAPVVTVSSQNVRPDEEYTFTIDTTDADLLYYEGPGNTTLSSHRIVPTGNTTEIRLSNSKVDAYRYRFTVLKNGVWSKWSDSVTVLVKNHPDDPTAPSGPPEYYITPEEPLAGQNLIIHVIPQEGASSYQIIADFEGGYGGDGEYYDEYSRLFKGYNVSSGHCTVEVMAYPIISDDNWYITTETILIQGDRPLAPVIDISLTDGCIEDSYIVTMDTSDIIAVHYSLMDQFGGYEYEIATDTNETIIDLEILNPGIYTFKAVAQKSNGIWTEWTDPIVLTVTEYATPTDLSDY